MKKFHILIALIPFLLYASPNEELIKHVKNGKLEEVKKILKTYKNPNATGMKQKTAIMYALEKDEVEIAKLLLNSGANITAMAISPPMC